MILAFYAFVMLAVICVGCLIGRYVPHVAGSWFGEAVDYKAPLRGEDQ